MRRDLLIIFTFIIFHDLHCKQRILERQGSVVHCFASYYTKKKNDQDLWTQYRERDVCQCQSQERKESKKRILRAVATGSQQQWACRCNISWCKMGAVEKIAVTPFFFLRKQKTCFTGSTGIVPALVLSITPADVTRPKFLSLPLSANLFRLPHFQFESHRCRTREIAFSS